MNFRPSWRSLRPIQLYQWGEVQLLSALIWEVSPKISSVQYLKVSEVWAKFSKIEQQSQLIFDFLFESFLNFLVSQFRDQFFRAYYEKGRNFEKLFSLPRGQRFDENSNFKFYLIFLNLRNGYSLNLFLRSFESNLDVYYTLLSLLGCYFEDIFWTVCSLFSTRLQIAFLN